MLLIEFTTLWDIQVMSRNFCNISQHSSHFWVTNWVRIEGAWGQSGQLEPDWKHARIDASSAAPHSRRHIRNPNPINAFIAYNDMPWLFCIPEHKRKSNQVRPAAWPEWIWKNSEISDCYSLPFSVALFTRVISLILFSFYFSDKKTSNVYFFC